ncbi:hypothetical protein BC943DRAFT_357699 [Umbelopsis sp. AD052]|nr:hypothetical protein BC943DRAFT_357699 [Umbelopsis sp. AD052]
MSSQKLQGKVAFITGSARNMGASFALALANHGASVVIHHRGNSQKEAEALATQIQQLGGKTLIVTGELANVQTIRDIFAKIKQSLGRLDIVINNAGEVLKKPLTDISEEEYDRLFAVNAKAPFFVMQEALKILEDNGRIVNVGTTLLAVTTGFYSAYAGSKAPLEDFTRAAAQEAGSRGITVNVVAPGPIDTPFFHGQESKESVDFFTNAVPLKRLGKVTDVVPVVEFLCLPESQWVTAQTILINGGLISR